MNSFKFIYDNESAVEANYMKNIQAFVDTNFIVSRQYTTTVQHIYSETCIILHALEETFCVGIDRVSNHTV